MFNVTIIPSALGASGISLHSFKNDFGLDGQFLSPGNTGTKNHLKGERRKRGGSLCRFLKLLQLSLSFFPKLLWLLSQDTLQADGLGLFCATVRRRASEDVSNVRFGRALTTLSFYFTGKITIFF